MVVLLAFDSEEHARSWEEYLSDDITAPDSGMTDIEISYLDLAEEKPSTSVPA